MVKRDVLVADISALHDAVNDLADDMFAKLVAKAVEGRCGWSENEFVLSEDWALGYDEHWRRYEAENTSASILDCINYLMMMYRTLQRREAAGKVEP